MQKITKKKVENINKESIKQQKETKYMYAMYRKF